MNSLPPLNSYLGLFALCNYFWFTHNTVGYPWGNGWWPLYRSWPLNKGWCTLNIFHYRVINFLVNMESIEDNHDTRVFELLFVTFNFRLLSAITLSKTKFLNFGWPLNRGKDNNWSIRVLFTVFYWQQFWTVLTRVLYILLQTYQCLAKIR